MLGFCISYLVVDAQYFFSHRRRALHRQALVDDFEIEWSELSALWLS